MKTVNQIRQDFFDFFESKDHTIVLSAPVIPHGDPTLLFTNAGMNQFKDVFLGHGSRSYTRAADTQKCIRVSGKHNDLEEVGRDGYHHTFFEMLGNWSFGDYYKKEAIEWAWELLTEVWKLPKDRLFATVFRDDDEAYELWKTVTDIDENQIFRFDEKDNFWEMGETGPCGPCSEVHYDRTPDKSGANLVNAGVPEVMEIWNLVFIQYNRSEDGTLTELPAKHVDTGMGLARIVSILQDKVSNYDTDIFTPIIQAIVDLSNVPYHSGSQGIPHQVIADHIRMISFAIADGGLPSNVGRGYVIRRILRRASRFGRKLGLHEPFLYRLVDALADHYDEIFPELKKQAQHVRRVIEAEETSFNRTLDRGIQLFEDAVKNLPPIKIEQNQYDRLIYILDVIRQRYDSTSRVLENHSELRDKTKVLLESICRLLHDLIGNIEKLYESEMYPELITEFRVGLQKIEQHQKDVKKILSSYEAESEYQDDIKFVQEEHFGDAKVHQREVKDMINKIAQTNIIRGDIVFNLYDTYGFPVDMTRQMAEERGLEIDEEGFERDMKIAKDRSRNSMKFKMSQAEDDSDWIYVLDAPDEIEFVGYETTVSYGHVVKYRMDEDEQLQFVLTKTPFYAESGGQIGDMGRVFNADFSIIVEDTQKINGEIVHLGKLEKGEITENLVEAIVDTDRRSAIRRNHTATHLLHKALREVLGTHVQQKGSLVAPDRLRFDFSHYEAIDDANLKDIETRINQKILENIELETEFKALEEAKQMGAMALFGEKYDEIVRMVKIGDYSLELCGGTHCHATGDIGLCKIVSESSISAGVRRVEAITGEYALHDVMEKMRVLSDAADDLRCAYQELPNRINDLQEKIKQLQKENEALQQQILRGQLNDLISSAVEVEGVKILTTRVNAPDPNAMKTMADDFRDKMVSGIAVLGAAFEDKVSIVVMVTDDLVKKGIKAGNIIKPIAKIVGGGGGGRPNLAQAGGKNPEKLDDALNEAVEIIKDVL